MWHNGTLLWDSGEFVCESVLACFLTVLQWGQEGFLDVVTMDGNMAAMEWKDLDTDTGQRYYGMWLWMMLFYIVVVQILNQILFGIIISNFEVCSVPMGCA